MAFMQDIIAGRGRADLQYSIVQFLTLSCSLSLSTWCSLLCGRFHSGWLTCDHRQSPRWTRSCNFHRHAIHRARLTRLYRRHGLWVTRAFEYEHTLTIDRSLERLVIWVVLLSRRSLRMATNVLLLDEHSSTRSSRWRDGMRIAWVHYAM